MKSMVSKAEIHVSAFETKVLTQCSRNCLIGLLFHTSLKLQGPENMQFYIHVIQLKLFTFNSKDVTEGFIEWVTMAKRTIEFQLNHEQRPDGEEEDWNETRGIDDDELSILGLAWEKFVKNLSRKPNINDSIADKRIRAECPKYLREATFKMDSLHGYWTTTGAMQYPSNDSDSKCVVFHNIFLFVN